MHQQPDKYECNINNIVIQEIKCIHSRDRLKSPNIEKLCFVVLGKVRIDLVVSDLPEEFRISEPTQELLEPSLRTK